MSYMHSLFVVNVVAMSLFAGSVSGLEAPYLISATISSDSSVGLAWRNNDAATTGFLIQRKDSTETYFSIVDSVEPPTISTYNDKKNLLSLMLYTYRIIAYSGDSMSEPSDTLQIRAPYRKIIFKSPEVKIDWNYDTSGHVRIMINEKSNVENGYFIYRADNISSSFNLICHIQDPNALKLDSIVWTDTTSMVDHWYHYRVRASSAGDTAGMNSSIYTFHTVKRQDPVTFRKLSDFPINFSGSGWSTKVGDSIFLKESPSPEGKISVINVKDPSKPKFGGYVDSFKLRSFPLESLIPLFLDSATGNTAYYWAAMNFQDKILYVKKGVLYMYQILDGQMFKLDSLRPETGYSIGRIFLLNDTILGTQLNSNKSDTYYSYKYFLPVILSTTGLIPLSKYYIGYSRSSSMGEISLALYFRGVYDGKILISVDRKEVKNNVSFYENSIVAYEVSSKRTMTIQGSLPNTNAINTGYYLSPTENLCTNSFELRFLDLSPSNQLPTELFVSDINNPHSYTTALENNALYRDTVHKQNELMNILLDKQNRHVFLLFKDNMTILSYAGGNTGAVRRALSPRPSTDRVLIINGPAGVTIILPSIDNVSNLYFYDLSGRCVDRLLNVTSNAVLWRPKTRSMGCYIVSVISGKRTYNARFLMK